MISETDSFDAVENAYEEFLEAYDKLNPYLDCKQDFKQARDSERKVSGTTLDIIIKNITTMTSLKKPLSHAYIKLKILYEQHKKHFPGSSFLNLKLCETIEEAITEIGGMLSDDEPIEIKYFKLGIRHYLQQRNDTKPE